MLRRWSVRLIILFQLALFSALSQASLLDSLMGSKPKFLSVEQAFPLTASVEQQQLIATFNANNDYYPYNLRFFMRQIGENVELFNYLKLVSKKKTSTLDRLLPFMVS